MEQTTDDTLDDFGGDHYCDECDEYVLPGNLRPDNTCGVCGGPTVWLDYLE